MVNYPNYPNYSRNPRFYLQSEQPSGSALVRNADETEIRSGEPPIILSVLPNEESLTKQMLELFEKLKPTESNKKREELAKKIEEILNEEWPGKNIKIHMFGSSMNELGTDKSDVDLCVTTEWNGLRNIFDLSTCLHRHGMIIEQIVSKAKVPIVRLSDPNLNLACDINVNNTLALHNTRLIRNYVKIDTRVRPLAMIVKYWARRRVLNDAAKGGTISTYTWTCIILNFLQMRDPPILPVLHKMPHDNVPEIIVNDEDASFYEDVETLVGYGEQNKESLGGLLFAFFKRMAFEFDYDNNVISLRQGKYLTKAEKGWDTCKGWKMLCVEEPFNTARNLGNSADDISVNGLRGEFRRAYEILCESASLDSLCEQFHFTNYYGNTYYNYNKNYNNRVNKGGFRRGSYRTNNSTGYVKSGNRPYVKFHNSQQNEQTNGLNDTTDNIHDNEEDRSSMPRFAHIDDGHYSAINSPGIVPIAEPTPVDHVKRGTSACPARKQFDNYQTKRERNGFTSSTTRYVDVNNSPQIQHQNVSSETKEDGQFFYNIPQRNVKNNNSRPIRKRNDERSSYNHSTRPDQYNNYGHISNQSQDVDSPAYRSNHDITLNPSQPFYKNSNQKFENNWNRSRFPSSEQKPSYPPNANVPYGHDTTRFNYHSRRPNTSNDSDQKPFVTNNNPNFSYDRTHHNKKLYSNKQEYNSRQVEDSNSSSIITSRSKQGSIVNDTSSLNSNFDRSNPVQMSSPKPAYKSNHYNNKNNNNKNTPRLTHITSSTFTYPLAGNLVMVMPNDSMYSANHMQPRVIPSSQSSQQQIYLGQSNDGPANYPRRNSHQSSSDGSNSQTSGNTSNTSFSDNSSSYIKHNHQKNNQENFQQQQRQNKPNSFNGKKARKYNNNNNNNNNNYAGGNNGYNNNGYEYPRPNNTTINSPSTFAINTTNDNEITVNISVLVNQGGVHSMSNFNGDTNGYKPNIKNYNPNSWKGSNGHNNITGQKIMNGNNNNTSQKSVNGGNNSSNRNVNNSNSSNNYTRSNGNNYNNYNNTYNEKLINGNNPNGYKSVDGSNNSNVQTKNFNLTNHSNSIKNGGNNNGNTNVQRNNMYCNNKAGRSGNKSIRRNSNAVKNSEGVNHQQQYSQETQLSALQEQNHYNIPLHQQNNNNQQEGGSKQKTGPKKNKNGQKRGSQRVSMAINDSVE